jgi:hypothetical protein
MNALNGKKRYIYYEYKKNLLIIIGHKSIFSYIY